MSVAHRCDQHTAIADQSEVVGEAVDGAEAVATARDGQPTRADGHPAAPALDGIEATRRILAAGLQPAPKVVILTSFDLGE